MGLLLDEANKIEAEKVAQMVILLISKANGCITSGHKYELRSVAQSSMWSTFHQLCRSQEMKQIWGVFVSSHPESCQHKSELAQHLFLDRVLKKLLHNKADAKKQSTASSQEVYVQLCGSKPTEEMSTKYPQLKVKRALFV